MIKMTILKYQDLAEELRKMGNIRAKAILIVLGALGIFPKETS